MRQKHSSIKQVRSKSRRSNNVNSSSSSSCGNGVVLESFQVKVRNKGIAPSKEYRMFFFSKNDQPISPWHDIPLFVSKSTPTIAMEGGERTTSKENTSSSVICNFICEIPKWTRAKFEICTNEKWNPIKQDLKNGKLRDYEYGDMMFNYGALPQTWEDPNHISPETGCKGDNDPVDVIEIGTKQLKTGSVTAVKILGVLGLLDDGETDWKMIAINIQDPLSSLLNDVSDVDVYIPGAIDAIRDWFRVYKTRRGNEPNEYAFDGRAMDKQFAKHIIDETHEMWRQKRQQEEQTTRAMKF